MEKEEEDDKIIPGIHRSVGQSVSRSAGFVSTFQLLTYLLTLIRTYVRMSVSACSCMVYTLSL